MPAIKRLVRNLLLDLRFGSFLGGRKPTALGHLGANDTSNSDYVALSALLKPLIRPDDVFVDVGCGKGRVLNWVLANSQARRIYGLELDEKVAAAVAERLRNYPRVTVIAGDAIRNLPSDATLLYLFNPFKRHIMERFRDAAKKLFSDPALSMKARIVYYNPVDIDLFRDDPFFDVTAIAMPAGFHAAYLVSARAS